jgi:membrane-associated protein
MFTRICSIFFELDKILPSLGEQYGSVVYIILFLVIFLETGVVFMPFLPGDSLLFAAGALTATTSFFSVHWVWLLLISAAIAGDSLNYHIGSFFGKNLSKNKWINPKHLQKAHHYFEKHGGKAIILGRFLPIIRTFVPFVAGMTEMSKKRFFLFNISGAFLWVTFFLYSGYLFGQLPFVKANFSTIILAIMVISFLPLVYDVLKWQFSRFCSDDTSIKIE